MFNKEKFEQNCQDIGNVYWSNVDLVDCLEIGYTFEVLFICYYYYFIYLSYLAQVSGFFTDLFILEGEAPMLVVDMM